MPACTCGSKRVRWQSNFGLICYVLMTEGTIKVREREDWLIQFVIVRRRGRRGHTSAFG